jgi:RNA polymerase sigma-70 factor (ECF subfamily)
MKLLEHLRNHRNIDNLRGWLFTVAAHAARDRQRRRMRWVAWAPSHERSVPPHEIEDADGRVEAARSALQCLPPRDRLLLALRANGLSYRDIAAAAGIKPTSVGRLLARAIDRWSKSSAANGRITTNRGVGKDSKSWTV